MGCGCSSDNDAASRSARATHGTSWPLDGHRRERRRRTLSRRDDSDSVNAANAAHPLSLTALEHATAPIHTADAAATWPRLSEGSAPQDAHQHHQPPSRRRRDVAGIGGIGGGTRSFVWRRWERRPSDTSPMHAGAASTAALHSVPHPTSGVATAAAPTSTASASDAMPNIPLYHSALLDTTIDPAAASDAPSTLPSAHHTPSTHSSAWLDVVGAGHPRVMLPASAMTVTASRGHLGGIPVVDSVDDVTEA